MYLLKNPVSGGAAESLPSLNVYSSDLALTPNNLHNCSNSNTSSSRNANIDCDSIRSSC